MDVPIRKDGTFSTTGLLPAKYNLHIPSSRLLISMDVDLTNGDVDGLVVEPEQTIDVRVSIRLESPATSGPAQLHARDQDKGSVQNAHVESGGAYLFKAIPPGIYRMESRPADHSS